MLTEQTIDIIPYLFERNASETLYIKKKWARFQNRNIYIFITQTAAARATTTLEKNEAKTPTQTFINMKSLSRFTKQPFSWFWWFN